MKKWNNPEFLNLELQETKENHTCHANKGDNTAGHSDCTMPHTPPEFGTWKDGHTNIQRDADGKIISCCSTTVSNQS